jgi:hypothetical protein
VSLFGNCQRVTFESYDIQTSNSTMEEIKAYLANPERTYEQGLELLAQHVKNNHLHAILKRDPQPERLDKKLADHIGLDSEKVAEKSRTQAVAPIRVKEKAKEADKQVDTLSVLLKDIYVERCKLSNELADTPEDQLPAKVEEIKQKIAHYNEVFLQRKALTEAPLDEDHPATEAEKLHAPKEVNSEILLLKAQMQPIREKIRSGKRSLCRLKRNWKN